MPKLADVNHLNAIRAFERAGFVVIRQGKHVIMQRGNRRLVIPRGNPINAFTMGGIIGDAGMTVEELKRLL
ncbi:MAG: type II toxin-antitoxin system HicA family toxin [Tepidisphaeraceae bacterium]